MNCAIGKKTEIMKEKAASRSLSNLGIKTPLNKILLLGTLYLF